MQHHTLPNQDLEQVFKRWIDKQACVWWQLPFDKENPLVGALAVTAHWLLSEHVVIGNFHFADSLFINEYLEDPILINLMAQKADGRGRYSVEALCVIGSSL